MGSQKWNHQQWGANSHHNKHCQTSPEYCAPNVSPTQQGPTQVSPTKQYVKTNISNTEVAHIHPSHTTNVNKHMTTHKHYFPHTESVVNDVQEQHVMCGKPHHPCPPCPPCPPHGMHRRF
ncbi:CotD family spore coat protein [Gracilibacillus alcaliphilus]|uniref:CotD family spore coat protein n=1 Tax=Gracilibacillus alcaliphilus TaxID=1401441 RepID=UPI00195D9A5B|nr:CotD family spore coat protein [Gracilibacillus alcaliphilus]MBM7678882.1 spore coat protein D [Gracilibacillus alcaliphilus]